MNEVSERNRRLKDLQIWHDQKVDDLYVKARIEKWDARRLSERLDDLHKAFSGKTIKLYDRP